MNALSSLGSKLFTPHRHPPTHPPSKQATLPHSHTHPPTHPPTKQHSHPPTYPQVPTAVFCQPPLGTVGLTEAQAVEQLHGDIDVYVSKFKPMKNTLR